MKLTLLTTLLLAALPAPAALTVYSDYASWAAAAGTPVSAITFQNATPGFYGSGYTEGGVFFQGLSAGTYNNYLTANNFGYCAPTTCLVGPATEAGALGATDGYLRSTLPAPVTAVAMDIGAYHSAGDIPVFRFSNGDSYTGPNLAPFLTFYGFISSTPFTYVDFHISEGTSGGDFATMDTFYATSSVPEPATWGLTGAALLAVGYLRRRR